MHHTIQFVSGVLPRKRRVDLALVCSGSSIRRLFWLKEEEICSTNCLRTLSQLHGFPIFNPPQGCLIFSLDNNWSWLFYLFPPPAFPTLFQPFYPTANNGPGSPTGNMTEAFLQISWNSNSFKGLKYFYN